MAVAATYFMNPTVVLDVTIGTVPTEFDITEQVSAVEIVQQATVLTRNTFGNTWQNKGRGLKGGTIKLDFFVDFDADGVFETFKTLWDDHELVGFTVSEAGGAEVTGSFVMSQMPTFSGAVDEYNVASLTFDLSGPVTNTPAA